MRQPFAYMVSACFLCRILQFAAVIFNFFSGDAVSSRWRGRRLRWRYSFDGDLVRASAFSNLQGDAYAGPLYPRGPLTARRWRINLRLR